VTTSCIILEKLELGGWIVKKSIKTLFIILSITMLAIVSACGTSGTDDEGQGAAGDTGGEEKKTLRVVTDAAYAPFESMDGDKIVGFDVEVLEAVLKEAGYEYELVNVGWDPLFVEIQDELADMAISAVTINDERKETYDFSIPYFESMNMILVPQDSDIQSGEDLKGKTVAVQNGTTGQEVAEGILGKNSSDVKKFENNVLAIMELTSGGADAVIADNAVVEEYVKNNPDQNLKAVKDTSFPSEFYGMLFPKDSELKTDIDAAMKTVIDNGTYTEIYKEWFGAEPNLDTLKEQQ
jgi:glutamine transport system substrate-binding protein